jgi:hypothetical protein
MIAATFHGASYAPPNYDFNAIEVFPSLEDVIEALFDRYSSNGQRKIDSTYLDGSKQSVFWPTVSVGDSFNCYLLGTKSLMPEYPALNEELVMEAHTAVHGGWKDYTVTLAESDEGTLRVIVERAGI